MSTAAIKKLPPSDTRSRKDLEYGIYEALLGLPATRLCPCNTYSEKDLLYNILLAARAGGGGGGLPDQAGHAGEFLTTDGTTASWAALAGGGDVVASGTLTLNAIALGAGGTSIKTTTTGTGVVTALGINTGSAGAFVVNGGPLGTPASGTLTNTTGLPISTGVAGLGANVATALAVAVGSAGAFITFNGNAGTPSALVGTNITGTAAGLTAGAASAVALGGISGLGANVATALAIAVGSAGAPVVLNGAGGTPSSLTLTNATGLPMASLVAGILAANMTLGESTGQILLDPSLSADGTWSGICEAGTAGVTLAFGDLVYFAAADSRWELVDASAAATAGSVMVGICVLAAAADGDPTMILRYGKVRADTSFPSFTVGAPVYASETAGDVTETQPTTTDAVIRVLGFAVTADSILFCPESSYMTHV